MDVLDLEPINEKKVFLFLLVKEKTGIFNTEAINLLDLFRENKFDLITSDLDTENKFNMKITKYLDDFEMHVFKVGIPENANGYLKEELDRKKCLMKELADVYEILEDKKSFKAQNIKVWIDLLKDDIEKEEYELDFKIRPQWIMKKFLDFIRKTDQAVIKLLHFTSEGLFDELKNLGKEMNMTVYAFEIMEPEISKKWVLYPKCMK
ncbi:MAG: hypothetical protein ACTSQO_00145 [Candidatus Helarchaeota archaeon]